jgi:predicted nucleic acid-binding Zn ribbon protein
MAEPEVQNSEEHVERKVVYETVSSSSTRSSAITIGIVVVIALAIIIWIVLQMR